MSVLQLTNNRLSSYPSNPVSTIIAITSLPKYCVFPLIGEHMAHCAVGSQPWPSSNQWSGWAMTWWGRAHTSMRLASGANRASPKPPLIGPLHCISSVMDKSYAVCLRPALSPFLFFSFFCFFAFFSLVQFRIFPVVVNFVIMQKWYDSNIIWEV